MPNLVRTDTFSSALPGEAPFSALAAEVAPEASPLRAAITSAYRLPEQQAISSLRTQLPSGAASQPGIHAMARRLVESVRAKRSRAFGVDALMHEFSLSSEEGVALMCLAEALLRIPDAATADRLIADKISKGDWRSHLGESPSLFVNAAAWGLLVTGKLVATRSEHGLGSALTRLISKGGEPLIRKGVDLAMRMLGQQFVAGQTIDEALANSRDREARGYRYSYDMLGEAALTAEDAANYHASYENAIHAIGRAAKGKGIRKGPGISVKLSALHPRYSRAQRDRVMQELLPRLKKLALLAKQYGIGINIDAEEADRLELSLDLMEALAFDADLDGFDGIGFVAQAYQKRCPFVIDYLIDLARRSGRRFMVRLVKGAYWDAEIKRAQVDGMPDYPVYTRKMHTDMSYLACAYKLLGSTDVIYPQFATHNAHSMSTIYVWAQQRGIIDYEFQCLYGMGETLYDQVVGMPFGQSGMKSAGDLPLIPSPSPARGEGNGLSRCAAMREDGVPCRIYAPVGSHRTLLAYLVRRLLENGANSSFVNQIVDDDVPVDALIADPFETAAPFGGMPHPNIPLPARLFGSERVNSAGVDLADEAVLRDLRNSLTRLGRQRWQAAPLLDGAAHATQAQSILNPADNRDLVGEVIEADETDIETALAAAQAGAADWQAVPPPVRADALMRAADLFEANRTELMALAVREAGKSLPNAVAEVREAVDFLRYYAAQARSMPDAPALGPVACISPWNFPLAIFTGEISASLAAGNVVLAKPAEQTPLIAHRSVQLMRQAGIPARALQLLPGRGETVGARLTADARVRGVLFTGSTEVAQRINRTLAERAAAESCDLPLIAETGGQNAMIVDSTALPEQVVQDAITSAFDSAGQRCSALRVLCLQSDIADRTLEMLRGAMEELRIGNPDRLAVDIGPVIDGDAQRALLSHIERMKTKAKDWFQLPLPVGHEHGIFVPPTVLEIGSLSELTHEVFGPVLHVIRYRREELPQLIDAINATGYGLTLGIHTRIDETIDFIRARARVGNTYVNRNMIGAVVGVQPFGGEGKSGTGPKAGGPLYLHRLRQHADDEAVAAATHEYGLSSGKPPAMFDLLQAWIASHGDQALAALAARYAQFTLLGRMIVLPGPTGERNTLDFAPRGIVLCAAADTSALLNQLAAAFSCGNLAAIEKKALPLLPDSFPRKLRDELLIIDQDSIQLHAALVDVSLAARMRPLLAQREGMIVPVITTTAVAPIPQWRLVAEHAVCINTAAAGGNASLMALRDGA